MGGTHRALAHTTPGTCTAQSGPGPGPRHMHTRAVISVISDYRWLADWSDQVQWCYKQHLFTGIILFHKKYSDFIPACILKNMYVNCKGYFMHGIGVPETIYLYLYFCDEWKGHYFLLLLYSQVDLLVPYFLIISTCRTLSSICKQQSKRFNRLYISCHCADTFMSIFQHLELFDSWLLVHCWCLELRSAGGPSHAAGPWAVNI